MKLKLTDTGDTSVGIFPQTWEVIYPGDVEDKEMLKWFKKAMSDIYSEFTEGILITGYDFEKTDTNYDDLYEDIEYPGMGIFYYPDFDVVVTEETVKNGYDSDKHVVRELLLLREPYKVRLFEIGQSSSTIYLEGFEQGFNSVNFKKVKQK